MRHSPGGLRVHDAAASQNLAVAPLGDASFRALADNAPVMMWRAGPDHRCDWFNRAWLAFTGRSLEQELGDGWAESVHPDDRERCFAEYVAACETARPFRLDYRLRRHDGEYRWITDSGGPFHQGDRLAGFFGSCMDVTEQREMEAHQQVLLSELQHRVKNNLQLIISFLALKARRVATEEAREVLEEVIQRVRAVGAIQERLHDSGGGGGVDLADYLPELARDVVNAEGSGAVTLTVDTAPVPTGVTQASTLGLMVNELLTNAMKHAFHGRGGELKLAIRPLPGGQAEIVIADSGPGFADEVLAAGGRAGSRGAGLVDALARKVPAALTRRNHDGAEVRLLFRPTAAV